MAVEEFGPVPPGASESYSITSAMHWDNCFLGMLGGHSLWERDGVQMTGIK